MSVPIKLSKANSYRKLHATEEQKRSSSNINEVKRNDNEIKLNDSSPALVYTQDTTPRGKSNMLASMIVLQKVHEHTGHAARANKGENPPAFRPTSGRFISMDTEPCLHLLKTSTWKDYFTGANTNNHAVGRPPTAGGVSAKHDDHVTDRRNPKADNDSQQFDNGISDTHSCKRLESKQEEMKQHLEYIFKNMVARVDVLWDQLKISKLERKFYRTSLCNDHVKSLQHCRELASYIAALQVHLSATIEVLKCIAARELAVVKCFDVIAALQRRKMRSRGGGGNNNSSAGDSGNTVADNGSNNAHGNNSFWREELIGAMDGVRCAALEVIKSIQLWRRNQWRPNPFIWNGGDYLSKMQCDMNILESESCQQMLSSLSLEYTDLLCIIFFREGGVSLLGGENISASGTKTRSPVPETKSSSFNAAEEKPTNENLEYIKSLVQEFKTNINPEELRAAANVVLDNATLQESLYFEKTALIEKGVFIPSLRHNHPPAITSSKHPSDDDNL